MRRRADQIEQERLLILARRRRELGGEGLDRKPVRNVGDGAQPADLGVRFGLAVLDADVLDVEGHVDEAHARLPIAPRAWDRARTATRSSARRCYGARRRPCRPCRAPPRDARPRPCGRSRCGCRPRASTRPSPALRRSPLSTSAASTAKSGFDLRPKPPPSSVTLTVTFSGGSSEYSRPDHARPAGSARWSTPPPCRRRCGRSPRAAPSSHARLCGM